MDAAAEYIRDGSAAIAARYDGDCVVHACRVAELLLSSGRAPWIGRVRDVTGAFHAPLVPLRYLGRGSLAWTTHYVACAGPDAYDPLLGAPVAVDELALAVFGRRLTVETFLDEAATARLLASGELRGAFRR